MDEQATVFNPAMFGFITKGTKGTKGGKASKKNFLYIDESGETPDMYLSIAPRTMQLVNKFAVNDRVDFAYDNQGRIVLYRGDARKLSTNSGCANASRRISLGSIAKDYVRLCGHFKRAYLEAKIHSSGQAVVFSPTGERDYEEVE